MDEPHYEPIFFTGRRRLRDASLMLTGTGRRPLRDKLPYEPEAEAYGTEALGRASLWAGGGGAYGTSLLTGRSADYGKRLRDELLRDDVPSLRDGGGGACGTGLLRRLRDEPAEAEAYGTRDEPPYGTPPYGPEALTARASFEPPYGTSLLARRHSRTNLRTKRRRFFTGRRRLRDASLRAEALTGRALYTGRRRLPDEPPYGPEAEAYGTSLLTGRRRWDEPPCGPERCYRTHNYWGGGAVAFLEDGCLSAPSLLEYCPLCTGPGNTKALFGEGVPALHSVLATLIGRASLRDPYTGRASLLIGRASLLILIRRRRHLRDEPLDGIA